MSSQTTGNLPTVFISHGLVGETLRPGSSLYGKLVQYAQDYKLSERVETIIVISGHWEDDEITVNFNPNPEIIHDHPSKWLFPFKFHFETDLVLANKIYERLNESGFKVNTTKTRGADHGAWGGVFSFYDIHEQQKLFDDQKKQHVPKVVLVSMHRNMDANLHYQLGKVLGEFRDEKTLFVCSGASTHNFNNNRKEGFTEKSKEWEDYLKNIICHENLDERKKLINFQSQDLYHYMHHSDDHFMPLLIALGSSNNPGHQFCVELQFTSMCSCYTFD